MSIELTHETRKAAIQSLERYFLEKMEAPIGNLAANGLLDFFLSEIGPVVYNQALEATKDRLVPRVMDIESELYVEPFSYWRKADRFPRKN